MASAVNVTEPSILLVATLRLPSVPPEMPGETRYEIGSLTVKETVHIPAVLVSTAEIVTARPGMLNTVSCNLIRPGLAAALPPTSVKP